MVVVATTETCWNVAAVCVFEPFIGIVLDQFADNNFIDMHGTTSVVNLYKHVTNSALPLV